MHPSTADSAPCYIQTCVKVSMTRLYIFPRCIFSCRFFSSASFNQRIVCRCRYFVCNSFGLCHRKSSGRTVQDRLCTLLYRIPFIFYDCYTMLLVQVTGLYGLHWQIDETLVVLRLYFLAIKYFGSHVSIYVYL